MVVDEDEDEDDEEVEICFSKVEGETSTAAGSSPVQEGQLQEK